MMRPASFVVPSANAAFNCAHYLTAPSNVRIPEAVALTMITPDGKENWTWKQILGRMHGWQTILSDHALTRGDRIVICLPNCPDIPALMLAAIASGYVPVVLSPQLRDEELDFITRHCEASMRIDASDCPTHDRIASARVEGNVLKLSLPQVIHRLEYARFSGEHPTYVETAFNDPAYMVYTSGTTGKPRGVVHAHRAVWARKMMFRGWTGIQTGDTVLHSGQLNWTYAMGIAIFDAWVQGARSIIYEGPRSAARWATLIRENRATIFAAVPSLYRQLCRDVPTLDEDTQSLRHALCAGEPLPASLWERWRDITHKPLYEALGMSECSTYISSGPDSPTRPGSPGRPQQGRRVAILEADSSSTVPCPPHRAGILSIHRDEVGLMLEYYNNTESQQKSWRGDWFLTGDLAAFDEDGYLHYHGRSDDTIITLGYRVGPTEIEAVLIQHASVREIAVNAYTPREGVVLICAHVVLNEGWTWNQVTEDALRALCAEHLAEYKRPHVYAVQSALPRNRSGKVLRKQLRYDTRLNAS